MYFNGKDGKVVFGADATAKVKDWSLNIDVDLSAAEVMGDIWKSNTVGLKSASGSVAFLRDSAMTIDELALLGTAVSMKLYTDATHYFTGDFIIKAVAPKVTNGATEESSITIQSNGALTKV
jgi:hypothetical protein